MAQLDSGAGCRFYTTSCDTKIPAGQAGALLQVLNEAQTTSANEEWIYVWGIHEVLGHTVTTTGVRHDCMHWLRLCLTVLLYDFYALPCSTNRMLWY